MSWRIRHRDGTYFTGHGLLGPTFDADREKAKTFRTSEEAAKEFLWLNQAVCKIEPEGK